MLRRASREAPTLRVFGDASVIAARVARMARRMPWCLDMKTKHVLSFSSWVCRLSSAARSSARAPQRAPSPTR